VFFIVTLAEKVVPATIDAGTDWLTNAAPFTAGAAVGVGVGVLVGVRVGEAARVGVAVGPGGVPVGVGVDPVPMEICAFELLFDMKVSASFPMTPATTLRVPTCRGTALRMTEETPEAGQETVVEGSPAAALAVQPAEEPPALKSTAGWKITVTAVPDAPVGAKNSTAIINGVPTFPPAGAERRVTERS
jgi:hypothetical protein